MKKSRLLVAAALLVTSVYQSRGTTFVQNFAHDPTLDGWQSFGNTNLFQWDATYQVLNVTWDSAQPNSYFHHPLGATMTSTNTFLFAFDFQLDDIMSGVSPEYPQSFQLAIGLLNFSESTNENFIIGTGYQAPDVVEFDYFPGFDIYYSSVTTPIISSENYFANVGFTFPFALVSGAHYHAEMIYTPENQTLHTTISSNGVVIGPIRDTTLYPGFGDFRVDTFSVSSYSQSGQDTSVHTNLDGSTIIYAGSLLAHGRVSKLGFSDALPVTELTSASRGSIQFNSTTNWLYTLERTIDFQTWTAVSSPVPGAWPAMTLVDSNPPLSQACYRVKAEWP